MEPILLYGFPSGTSMGLVAALEWLGQPYRLSRVDMLGEMRTPAYARLNPRYETPVLITSDGRPLTEPWPSRPGWRPGTRTAGSASIHSLPRRTGCIS